MGMDIGGGGDWQEPGVQTVLSEINVTPFVDVMLVLLVIFMVTAPLLTQGMEVNLPRVSAANLEQIRSTEGYTIPDSIAAEMQAVMEALKARG